MLYYFRAFLIFGYFAIFLVLANLLALLRPFHPNNTHWILKLFKPAYGIMNLTVEPINRKSPPEKPVVYICNHQDLLDIFMFSHVWPENTVVVGKRSLFLLPLFGTAFWLAGNIFINRKNKSHAWSLMDQISEAIKSTGKSVAFMPEGTRSRGKGLLPFKLGAFAVAIKAQADIIPICASSTNLIDINKRKAQKAYVEFLSPISTKGLNEKDVAKLAETCHQKMREAIERLDKKITECAA